MFFFRMFKQLTLIELVITLGILAIASATVVTMISVSTIRVGPDQKDIYTLTTEANLQTLSKAILGTSTQKGYYQHMGQHYSRMPRSIADLFRSPSYLPLEFQNYQASSRLGWRGPYCLLVQGRYGMRTAKGFQFRHGFSSAFGQPADPAILDGWGNPIILQIDFDGNVEVQPEEARYARLVSAGPNGRLETPMSLSKKVPGKNKTSELTLNDCGDDLVLFLQVADLRE